MVATSNSTIQIHNHLVFLVKIASNSCRIQYLRRSYLPSHSELVDHAHRLDCDKAFSLALDKYTLSNSKRVPYGMRFSKILIGRFVHYNVLMQYHICTGKSGEHIAVKSFPVDKGYWCMPEKIDLWLELCIQETWQSREWLDTNRRPLSPPRKQFRDAQVGQPLNLIRNFRKSSHGEEESRRTDDCIWKALVPDHSTHGLSERFLSVACTIAGEDEECSTIATARCYLRECAVLVIFTALRKGSMAGSCVGSTPWWQPLILSWIGMQKNCVRKSWLSVCTLGREVAGINYFGS